MSQAVEKINPDTIPEPTFNDIQQCPRCEHSCNREHFSWEWAATMRQCVTYLYCAECLLGWETLWRFNGHVWQVTREQLVYDPGVDAEKWHEFMKHLEAARSIAA